MSLTIDTLAHQLKTQTEVLHKEAEDLLMASLSGIRNKADYIAILRMFYGFYSPLEHLIPPYITGRELEDFPQRAKSQYILNDLKSLTHSEGPLELCNRLPQVSSVSEAFGVLYVLEGSTLGGRYIYKMLLQQHGEWLSSQNLSFFHGYGDQTGFKWKTFQHSLNQLPEREYVITAAKQTFFYLKDWINQNLYHG